MILLIDGNNLLHRVMHALGVFQGRWPGGHGGTFGFLKNLRATLDAHRQVRETIVVWDGGVSARRRALLREYKVRDHRPDASRLLMDQATEVTAACTALGIRTVQVFGCEADDLLAALARAHTVDSRKVLLWSEDRDLLQTVSDFTTVYRPMRGDHVQGAEYITPDTFPQFIKPFPHWGWLPFRVLTGDGSDKIPGVKGLGDRTATLIVQAWCMRGDRGASLTDNLCTAATAVGQRGNTRAFLATKARSVITRNLALMDLTVEPLPASVIPFAPFNPPVSHPEVVHLFGLWNFKSLLDTYETWIRPFEPRLPVARTALRRPYTYTVEEPA